MANTTLVKSPLKRVSYMDFLKRYEAKGLLGEDNERSVRRCLHSICSLVYDYLPEAGRHAFISLPLIIDGKLTQDEVDTLRIEVWEVSEKFLNATKEFNAMKAILCSLYDASVHRSSYYDVLSGCIRFVRSVIPDMDEQRYSDILQQYFEPANN